MGDNKDGTKDDIGLSGARAEKEAIYPEKGYVFAEIDLLKPPGKALTKLDTSLKLTDITIPEATELTDYVVYDPEGHSYTHKSLRETVENPDTERVETLCNQAQVDNVRVKRHALYGLAEIAADQPDLCLDAVSLLAEKLQGSELDIRAMALEGLATIAEAYPNEVEPATIEIIELLDPAVDTRLYPDAVDFVATLADHNPENVINAAPKLGALLEENTGVSSQALVALKRIAETYPDAVVPAVPDLKSYVVDGDASQRIGALAVLGQLSKEYPDVAESMIPTASRLLAAESDRLRANAAGLLADLADAYPHQVRTLVPDIVEMLDDSDEKARYNATSILARIAKVYPEDVEPAIKELMDTLTADFAPARANACWALGYLEAEPALEQLEELAEIDPSEEVRNAATFAVTEIRADQS